jgi:predicted RNase H-like HicB family nuclease
MTSYIALLRKDADSDFGVEFPDFPGCVTAARTLEAARSAASEALALHVEGVREDGTALPTPSSLDTIMADAANRSAVAFLVDVPARPARSVRINVMLPADLVAAIDGATTNRSGFLAEAARARLRMVR